MSKEFKQYTVKENEFDGYNKESPIQEALGSRRTRQRQEASDIRSTNYRKGVSGWKISPSGIETTKFGTVAPTTTPSFIGEEYVDTAAGKLYKAMGTSSAADWILIN